MSVAVESFSAELAFAATLGDEVLLALACALGQADGDADPEALGVLEIVCVGEPDGLAPCERETVAETLGTNDALGVAVAQPLGDSLGVPVCDGVGSTHVQYADRSSQRPSHRHPVVQPLATRSRQT